MRLYRELFLTALTFIALAIGFSVTQGWNWPVVGSSVSAAILVSGGISLVACVTSGWITRFSDSSWYRDPWLIAGAVLGIATLAVAVIGLYVGTTLYLFLMLAGIAALWVVGTVHHLLTPEPAAGRHLPTPA